MYSPKTGPIAATMDLNQEINIGFHVRENPSEVAISESSQIRELHETIKL